MALSEQEVRDLWVGQWSILKPFVAIKDADGYIHPESKEGKLPEPWTGYARAWEQRESLMPHIEKGVFPDRLFHDRAPNQSQEEFDYIKNNYRQVTLNVFEDAKNTVGRALHPNNWSMQWAEGDAVTDAVREHVERGIKEFGSLENFFIQTGPKLKFLDPMGVVTFLPTQVDVIEREDGENVVDPGAEIKPEIIYSDCTRVWGFEYDSWYLIRLNTSSEVEYGGKIEATGVLCWLIDDSEVWEIRQVGKKIDWEFSYTKLYTHNSGEAPCHHFGGVPTVIDGHLFFESPYLAAKEPLDVALTDANYLQASKVKTVFPQVVLIGDTCEYRDTDHNNAQCIGGWIEYFEGEKAFKHKCPNCHGTGKSKRLGPLNEIIITPKESDGISGGDTVNATNALAYISPSTESVRFLREEYEYNIRQARKIIHLDSEAPMAGGDAKTATEVGLGSKARDAFVKSVADQLLRIIHFGAKMMGRQMAGPEWDGVSLRTPTSYDIRTEEDRMAEISAAKSTGLPPPMIEQMVDDLMATRYASDPWMREAMEVLRAADAIGRMSENAVNAGITAGRIKPWQEYLHFSGLDLYRELMETDTAFARMDNLWEKVKYIQQKAMERNPDPVKTSPAMDRLSEVVRK